MDHILIQVFLSGGGICGGSQEIAAGDMLIIDLDQPHHMLNSDFKNLTLLVPRDLDPALSDLLAPLHGKRLGADNPMVRFIGEHMIALWRHVPDMEITQAGGALQGTLGLMAVAGDMDTYRANLLNDDELNDFCLHLWLFTTPRHGMA
jgi:hypothetical protein